ncbi:hypothetical protein NDU88_005141 [Pleurodeles waltl]|uniref:Uncharacterized protein n=1 Tax=Pleurodeles waltl TaxID=8319 RepID=A0AAV7T9K0_PLEWA|nr:hypothetical protein NDU88_005141 [Pleurodeles waltl]
MCTSALPASVSQVLRHGRARRDDAPLEPRHIMVLPGMTGFVVSLGAVVRRPRTPAVRVHGKVTAPGTTEGKGCNSGRLVRK